MPSTTKFAVITGASSGIGFELARVFAEHRFDVMVAAEDDGLTDAAAQLRTAGVDVSAVRVDLADPAGVAELYEAVSRSGRPVDALALNAGIGSGGPFVGGSDLDKDLRIIDLNVRSTVHLAKLILPAMVARHQGRVLFTSSIASMMPGAYQAVYNASKSFVQSFALALRRELKDSGVTVTSLMPGPTDTRFFERASLLDTKLGTGPKDDPADVARMGFEAMMKGDERVVASSLRTKAQAAMSKVMPDRFKAGLHAKMAKPGTGRPTESGPGESSTLESPERRSA